MYSQFLTSVGVPEDWCMTDVYGLDSELLSIIPQPALALLLLFPITEKVDFFNCFPFHSIITSSLLYSLKHTLRSRKRPAWSKRSHHKSTL